MLSDDTSFDVRRTDLPDPSVLCAAEGFYIYATNSGGVNVPVLFTRHFETYEVLGDALPVLPLWAEAGFTWAPEVTRLGDSYRLYFTARLAGSGCQVIGVATARTPAGPFTAQPDPLVCMRPLGGAIDPAVYVHGQDAYLYWKNDGNAAGLPTTLWGAELSEDGLQLRGERIPLLGATEPWEHGLVEAPQVIEEQGVYHLIYSCADFGNASYAVGHASGRTALGPFQKDSARPLLASDDTRAGPGHSHAFKDQGGQWRLAYHAWPCGQVGYPHGHRGLHVLPLHLTGTSALVH